MKSDLFNVVWWPSGQSERGRLLPSENTFYICLKMNTALSGGPALVFCRSDNLIWEDEDRGYIASFEKAFFDKGIWRRFEAIDLFKEDNPFHIGLVEEDVLILAQIFGKICGSLDSAYLYKLDLIRTYLFQIIHITVKLHLQRINPVNSPVRYALLTTCGLDMFVRIKLSYKKP